MNIAVLFGGLSTERNVSINGGRAVCKALQTKGHNVFPIDPAFGADGLRTFDELVSAAVYPTKEELANFSPKKIIECVDSKLFNNIDCAFIVLHGKYGEDGLIQSLLELRGVPYTGSDTKASAVGIDKNTSKLLFLSAGVATPQWEMVHLGEIGNYDYYDEIRDAYGSQIVVKPNDQGSTIGLSIIRDGNLDDLHKAILLASEYSKSVMIERYIEGREITVGMVGNEVLPVIEIIPEGGFYDYTHKYSKGHTRYVCPAEISEDIAEFVQQAAFSAFNVLGCSGLGRADFRLNEDGQPLIMEMNTIPGFTETSLVPMAAKEVGIEFPDLCERIIEIALGEEPKNEE